jgi:hypothetical protein
MTVIKQVGNRIIDTEYHSKKFGLVVMDITAVERETSKETTRYLMKLEKKRREKNDSM